MKERRKGKKKRNEKKKKKEEMKENEKEKEKDGSSCFSVGVVVNAEIRTRSSNGMRYKYESVVFNLFLVSVTFVEDRRYYTLK